MLTYPHTMNSKLFLFSWVSADNMPGERKTVIHKHTVEIICVEVSVRALEILEVCMLNYFVVSTIRLIVAIGNCGGENDFHQLDG